MYDRTIKMFDEPHIPIQLEKEVKSGLYNKSFLAYWESYLIQIKTIVDLNVSSVIEVGPGGSFLSDNLKKIGLKYDTIDIFETSKPIIKSSLENLNPEILKKKYDIACAFQILEHIPYNMFCDCLKKLAVMSKKYIAISLPYSCVGYRKTETKWKGQNKKIYDNVEEKFEPTNLPNRKYREEYIKEFPWAIHFWEIGRQGFSLDKVLMDIKSTKLKIIKKFHSPNPYHYFIILNCEGLK